MSALTRREPQIAATSRARASLRTKAGRTESQRLDIRRAASDVGKESDMNFDAK